MPRKTPIALIYAAIAAIVVLLAIAAWFAFLAGPGPQLTDAEALSVLNLELSMECLPGGIEGSYKSCITEIYRMGEGWLFKVTFDGLYDDSVKASRVEAYFTYQNGRWSASDIVHTSQCYAGRGHEDFSIELCV